jgi:type IV pilus assembly protein PilE
MFALHWSLLMSLHGGYEMIYKKGFTLIELMVVVAIMAILATIAIPSYMQSVQRSARSEAIGHVLELASTLSTVKALTMSYEAGDGETHHTSRYQISATLDDGGGFVITATPIEQQAQDRCGEIVYYTAGLWLFGGGLSYDECVS